MHVKWTKWWGVYASLIVSRFNWWITDNVLEILTKIIDSFLFPFWIRLKTIAQKVFNLKQLWDMMMQDHEMIQIAMLQEMMHSQTVLSKLRWVPQLLFVWFVINQSINYSINQNCYFIGHSGGKVLRQLLNREDSVSTTRNVICKEAAKNWTSSMVESLQTTLKQPK